MLGAARWEPSKTPITIHKHHLKAFGAKIAAPCWRPLQSSWRLGRLARCAVLSEGRSMHWRAGHKNRARMGSSCMFQPSEAIPSHLPACAYQSCILAGVTLTVEAVEFKIGNRQGADLGCHFGRIRPDWCKNTIFGQAVMQAEVAAPCCKGAVGDIRPCNEPLRCKVPCRTLTYAIVVTSKCSVVQAAAADRVGFVNQTSAVVEARGGGARVVC